MIKIICLGKIKEKFFIESINEYKKRLSKYTKLEIIELKDEQDKDVKKALSVEKELIMKHLSEKDNIILLDVNGKEMNSYEFSKMINQELTYNSNIAFIIGSSNGFDEEISKITSKKISFSKMTFPHQLFRIILLEQIYRSFKILNNESYHK